MASHATIAELESFLGLPATRTTVDFHALPASQSRQNTLQPCQLCYHDRLCNKILRNSRKRSNQHAPNPADPCAIHASPAISSAASSASVPSQREQDCHCNQIFRAPIYWKPRQLSCTALTTGFASTNTSELSKAWPSKTSAATPTSGTLE